MQIKSASLAGSGGKNEDRVRIGDGWALVLDGAGRYPGRTGGCVHPVTWVVNHLADHLSRYLIPQETLSNAVRQAIQATMSAHAPVCDLTDPLSPGAALAVVRVQDEFVEWLVLGDCAVAVDRYADDPLVTIDDRVDRLPNAPVIETQIRTYDPDYVATVRNKPGGFWVAAATPAAADHALTGNIAYNKVKRALICSDGVTRLTERHGWTWRDMFAHAEAHGPEGLVDAVRHADAADLNPRRWRGKAHDDATAVFIRAFH